MKTKNKKGFSLIELLIIISIISIMSAVSITKLMSNKAQKEVEAAAREIAGAIREAQGYAITGKTIVATDTPCRYDFYTNSNNNYNIGYYNRNATGCSGTWKMIVSSKKFLNGVVSASDSSVSFSVPFGVIATGGNTQIDLYKSSQHRYICICQTGKILEKVTACSFSTDPKDC